MSVGFSNLFLSPASPLYRRCPAVPVGLAIWITSTDLRALHLATSVLASLLTIIIVDPGRLASHLLSLFVILLVCVVRTSLCALTKLASVASSHPVAGVLATCL